MGRHCSPGQPAASQGPGRLPEDPLVHLSVLAVAGLVLAGRFLIRPMFQLIGNLGEREMFVFAEKAQKARFTCLPFEKVFQHARRGSVIYCDPERVLERVSETQTRPKSISFGQVQEQ